MRVYLSGAISGDKDYMAKFKAYEGAIKANHPDWEVINPARVGETLPDSFSHADHMDIDFALLSKADRMYQLPGWQESMGACMEYGYARAKGILVIG